MGRVTRSCFRRFVSAFFFAYVSSVRDFALLVDVSIVFLRSPNLFHGFREKRFQLIVEICFLSATNKTHGILYSFETAIHQ